MLKAIRERRLRKEQERLRKERERRVKEFTDFLCDKYTDDAKLEIALNRARPLFDGTTPVEVHLAGLKDRLDSAKLDELVGNNQGELVEVYRAIHDAFQRHDLIDIHRLAAIPKDVNRINQIEAIIDLYNLKLMRTREDKKLSEKEKDRKVQALEHLMEKDIEALGGAL